MRFFAKTFVLNMGLLCGGLCFAAAPISTVSLGTGTVEAQPLVPVITTPATPASTNSTPTAVNTQPEASGPPAPVVNSAALLATLTPEQRIARLENQVQYLSTFNNQIQTLSTEVEVLRGQMEDLSYQVKLLKKQVDALNPPAPVATDNTGNAPNASPAATTASTPATATPTTAVPAAPSAKEQAAFNQANTLLLKQQYTDATTAFNNFLTTYPNSTLAPDAHYWLGDLYLAQGQPDNASQQYRAVVNVANATKRPDAMVKLGTILLAYGDSAHAKELFQQVLKQYPNTPAATQAQTRLKSM